MNDPGRTGTSGNVLQYQHGSLGAQRRLGRLSLVAAIAARACGRTHGSTFKTVPTEAAMRGYQLDFLLRTMVLIFFALLFRFSLAPVLHAETQFDFTPEVDRLLRSGLNRMYSYDLQEADESFDELVRRFPEHPIGYMHKAEVVWWHALRDNKNQKLEADFERYTELAISKGHSLLKKDPKNFYALLYVAGAYGNRTRYNVYVNKSYYRAMRAGIKGYDFVGPAQALRPNYVDCLIGTGAYNYFAGSIPTLMKIFAWMFTQGGDKEKGIQQLELAAQKGEYGQIAARMVLLGVYYNEKRFDDYQRLTSELIEQFPTNPVFVMWLADFHIRQRRLDEGDQRLTLLLDKGKTASRSKLSLAQISYEKGRVLLEKQSADDAAASLTRVVDGDLPGGDPLLAKARLLRGCAWDLQGKREQAVADYQAVLLLRDTDDCHRKARGFLKHPYRGKTRS